MQVEDALDTLLQEVEDPAGELKTRKVSTWMMHCLLLQRPEARYHLDLQLGALLEKVGRRLSHSPCRPHARAH